MARLSSFHLLCPLIDHSSFLGVANDSSKDCVVVTLGRNIVIRYKISDRKQVGSWSTREKLSSPVIYDHVGCQYVAVFNGNHIRTWTQDDEDLDTVKKYKFPEEIQTVLVCPDSENEPVVLFQSGRLCRLSNFLKHKEKILEFWKQKDKRGSNAVLKSDETLEDFHMISCRTETYVVLSARSSNMTKRCTFYFLKLCEDDKEYSVVRKFSLKLPESRLVGHTVIHQKHNSSLITLWSNGKIYSLSLNFDDETALQNDSERCKGVEIMSPGRVVDSVKRLIDVENVVALVSLGSNHLALYGAESASSGAVVYIVGIHSSVTGDLPWEALKESAAAAKQCLKYFDANKMPPRIWNAAGHIFIPSSDGRLVLASYELGHHPPLSILLGCLGKNKTSVNNNGLVSHQNQMQQVSWLNNGIASQQSVIKSPLNVKKKPNMEEDNISLKDNMPEKVSVTLKPLIKKGFPESSICSIIFPALMEEGDVESISWCLAHFRDIPERNLVDLLCFFLSQRTVTSPCKKEEVLSKDPTSCNSEEKNVLSTPIKVASKPQPVEAVKNLTNGNILESMDTNSSDSFLEESEMKSAFEVGHTFVKGRRRSLRVMKVSNTPQKYLSPSKVNSTTKKVGKGDTDYHSEQSDMEVDTPANPLHCVRGKNVARNLLVLNGLDVVEENVEIAKCKPNGLKNLTEENILQKPISSSPSNDNIKCLKRKQVDRTSSETFEGFTGRPSALVEEEKRLESMALPHGQRKPVGKLLSVPVSSVILLPPLRSHLPFHLALKLLRHLLWLLSTPEPSESSNPTQIQLVDWVCYLLDAFYQRYTISQDEEVLETLAAVKEVLDMQLEIIEDLKEMEPLLLQLKSGKMFKENACDKWYSIENIRLY